LERPGWPWPLASLNILPAQQPQETIGPWRGSPVVRRFISSTPPQALQVLGTMTVVGWEGLVSNDPC
jgi:hypothetical protein